MQNKNKNKKNKQSQNRLKRQNKQKNQKKQQPATDTTEDGGWSKKRTRFQTNKRKKHYADDTLDDNSPSVSKSIKRRRRKRRAQQQNPPKPIKKARNDEKRSPLSSVSPSTHARAIIHGFHEEDEKVAASLPNKNIMSDILQTFPNLSNYALPAIKKVISDLHLTSFDANDNKQKREVLDAVVNAMDKHSYEDRDTSNDETPMDEESVVEEEEKIVENVMKTAENEKPSPKRKRRRRKKRNTNKVSSIDSPLKWKKVNDTCTASTTTDTPTIDQPMNIRSKLLSEIESYDICSMSAHQQLNEWIFHLQSSKTQSNSYFIDFYECNILEKLIQKLMMSGGTLLSIKCQQSFVSLLNEILCGDHNYHTWLFKQLVSLARSIVECLGSKNDIQRVIAKQCCVLIHTQCEKNYCNYTQIDVDREIFDIPTKMMNKHTPGDKIIARFMDLDHELNKLSDTYHSLKTHDMYTQSLRPTTNEDFHNQYKNIRSKLHTIIDRLNEESNILNGTLQGYKRRKKQIQKDTLQTINPLQQSLDEYNHERHILLEKQRKIKRELEEINDNLSAIDKDIEIFNQKMEMIQNENAPLNAKLQTDMHENEFKLAGISREQQCYQTLHSIVDQSWNQIEKWSNALEDQQSGIRHSLESKYITSLTEYLRQYSSCKDLLIQRISQLRSNVHALKSTTKQNRTLFGHVLPEHSEHMNTYEASIELDKNVNNRCSMDIIKHVERAQSICHRTSFNRFLISISEYINKHNDISKFLSSQMASAHADGIQNISMNISNMQHMMIQQQIPPSNIVHHVSSLHPSRSITHGIPGIGGGIRMLSGGHGSSSAVNIVPLHTSTVVSGITGSVIGTGKQKVSASSVLNAHRRKKAPLMTSSQFGGSVGGFNPMIVNAGNIRVRRPPLSLSQRGGIEQTGGDGQNVGGDGKFNSRYVELPQRPPQRSIGSGRNYRNF